MVHQIFLKCLYAKPRIGIQGEVEIPFSSLGFAQIKFRSLIFVKIFLQLHFLCILSWDSSQIYFHLKNEANPRSSFTTSGLFARGHESKKPYYSHITIYVHLKRFISNLCVFVNNYHLQFILIFSTLEKSFCLFLTSYHSTV